MVGGCEFRLKGKVIQFCLILFSFFFLLILFCCFQTSKLRWDSLTEMTDMHVFYSCKQFTCLQECYVILIALISILLNLLLLLIHFFLTCWFCVKVIQFCLILFSFFFLLILFCCFQTSKLRWDSLTEMPACYELMQVRKRLHGVCASLSEMGEYYSQKRPTPLLDTINYPIHMKNLSTKVQ